MALPHAPQTNARHAPLRAAGPAAALALLAALAGAQAGCQDAAASKAEPLSQAQQVQRVTVAHAALGPRTQVWHAHGVLAPADTVSLAFEVGGRLSARPIAVGDRLAADALVARVEAEPYRNARAAARAEVSRWQAQRDQSQRDLKRARTLEARGALPAAQAEANGAGAEALGAAVAGARAQAAEADRRLARTVLRAPYAAVVAAVFAEPGELLAPGQPVALLHAEGPLEVALSLTDDLADRLRLGDVVQVSVPGEAEDRTARVVELARSALGPGQLVPARLKLDADGGLRAGQAVEVRVSMPAGEALRVPLRSVADPSGSGPWVYRVTGDHVDRVPVSLGALDGDSVTITSGLQPGDAVVTSHLMGLLPGQPVQVTP